MTKKELKKKLLESKDNLWTDLWAWNRKSLRTIDKVSSSPYFPFCNAMLAGYHHRAGFIVATPNLLSGEKLYFSGAVFASPKEACLSFDSQSLFCYTAPEYSDMYTTAHLPAGIRTIGQLFISRVLSEVASEEGLVYSTREDLVRSYYYIRLEGKDCVWKALELPYKIRDKINALGPSLSKKTPLYI